MMCFGFFGFFWFILSVQEDTSFLFFLQISDADFRPFKKYISVSLLDS